MLPFLDVYIYKVACIYHWSDDAKESYTFVQWEYYDII